MKAADSKLDGVSGVQTELFLVATLTCIEKAFTAPPHWANISKVKFNQFVARPPKHQKRFPSV